MRGNTEMVFRISKNFEQPRGENYIKVLAILSTVLSSTPRILTKVINARSARTNGLRDIAIFRLLNRKFLTPDL